MKRALPIILLSLIEFILLVYGIYSLITSHPYQTVGCILWGLVVLYIYSVRPGSRLHISQYTDTCTGKISKILNRKNVMCLCCTLLVLACILPMGASPAYNGTIPEHRNQYELLARSLAHGHIYIEYDDIDPGLDELINPYDPAERDGSGVHYHSDNAYYKGKYYMYFGVVPVIMLFLPYFLITGHDLTTYHATQFYTAFAIIGIFLLFYQISKHYYKKMSTITLVSLSTALSLITISCGIAIPALYCTATSSAVCMMIWSFYFFFISIYVIPADKKVQRTSMAMLGSLFGALAFGCRPSSALGNLVLIPFFLQYLKSEKEKNEKQSLKSLTGRIFLIALPYIIIGVILMIYNYARFESPFEFGQSYQLTGADQSHYLTSLENFSEVRIINGLLYNFIGFTPIAGPFPYTYYHSAFVNFPILLFVFGIFFDKNKTIARKNNMYTLMVTLFISPIIITAIQICQAPGNGSAERYRMDIYNLMIILTFLIIGIINENMSDAKRGRFNTFICLLCLWVIVITPLFILYPCEYNYTHLCPEGLDIWRQIYMLH